MRKTDSICKQINVCFLNQKKKCPPNQGVSFPLPDYWGLKRQCQLCNNIAAKLSASVMRCTSWIFNIWILISHLKVIEKTQTILQLWRWFWRLSAPKLSNYLNLYVFKLFFLLIAFDFSTWRNFWLSFHLALTSPHSIFHTYRNAHREDIFVCVDLHTCT